MNRHHPLWKKHPRLAEVRALVRFEGETRSLAVAMRLGIPHDVAKCLLAVALPPGVRASEALVRGGKGKKR